MRIQQLDPRQCRTAQAVKFDTGVKSELVTKENNASAGEKRNACGSVAQKKRAKGRQGEKTRYRKTRGVPSKIVANEFEDPLRTRWDKY